MFEALLRMSNGHFQHHNIVRYWDFFESPTKYYVVMEKLKGCELSVALTENGAKWSERQCAGVMRDLLSALQFLHEVAGIYHRDVKLENLMFRGRTSGPMAGRKVDGDLVLLDFGLARFVGQKWDGMYVGTERYAAPEVVAKRTVASPPPSTLGCGRHPLRASHRCLSVPEAGCEELGSGAARAGGDRVLCREEGARRPQRSTQSPGGSAARRPRRALDRVARPR